MSQELTAEEEKEFENVRPCPVCLGFGAMPSYEKDELGRLKFFCFNPACTIFEVRYLSHLWATLPVMRADNMIINAFMSQLVFLKLENEGLKKVIRDLSGGKSYPTDLDQLIEALNKPKF